MAATAWNTKFMKLFPWLRVPIMGAPMAGVSNGLLAAETCRAGAMGFVAAGHNQSEDELEQEIEIFRQHTTTSNNSNVPLCIGFIGHSTFKNQESTDRFIRVMERHRPQVVQFFAPSLHSIENNNNIELAHSLGAKVICQVGSVHEARRVLQHGADVIVAQGTEAGGHGLRSHVGNGTIGLASRIVSIANNAVPILAAGGIVDGRGLVAALALGCHGVVLGTRLWASQEATGHEPHKEILALPETEPDNCIRTTVLDQVRNTFSSAPWPYPYDSSGVVNNEFIKTWNDKSSNELEEVMPTIVDNYRQQDAEKNVEFATIYAGEGVGDIHSIDPTFDIITRIDREAREIITSSLPNTLVEKA